MKAVDKYAHLMAEYADRHGSFTKEEFCARYGLSARQFHMTKKHLTKKFPKRAVVWDQAAMAYVPAASNQPAVARAWKRRFSGLETRVESVGDEGVATGAISEGQRPKLTTPDEQRAADEKAREMQREMDRAQRALAKLSQMMGDEAA